MRSAISDAHDNQEVSERQRNELKEAMVGAVARITELEAALAHEHSKAEVLAELTRELPTPAAIETAAPSVELSAVVDLLSKVNTYRTTLATQRSGAELLLAFDEVFLAANKL